MKELLNNGLNVIAKRATIPKGTTIERNCRIFSYVDVGDFPADHIKSGSTISSEVGQKVSQGDEEKVIELNM